MSRISLRRFQISDGLTLIASTGLALGACRLWLSGFDVIKITLATGISLCSIPLLVWTLWLLSFYLGTDSRRRKRRWSEPGFLACITVVLAYVWNAARMAFFYGSIFLTQNPSQHSSVTLMEVIMAMTERILVPHFPRGPDVGGAILIVWFITWTSGRCRLQSNWIDRAGRILGVAWVALTLAAVLSI